MNNKEKPSLSKQWDLAAKDIDVDVMRVYRYGWAYNFLKKYFKQNTSIKIIDIGCGEGSGLNYFSEMGYKDISGIDISPERVNIGSKRYGNKINIKSYDGKRVPYEDNTFDVVISMAVIEHVESKIDFAAEISRVLKPGGLAVIDSDCYTWRILQILGYYKSVQPIDRTILPWNYVNIFRQQQLKLLGYKTFNHPNRNHLMIDRIFPDWKCNRPMVNTESEEVIFKKIANINIPNLDVKDILLSFYNDENIFVFSKKN